MTQVTVFDLRAQAGGVRFTAMDDFTTLPAFTDWVKVFGDYAAQVHGGAGAAVASVVERSPRDPAGPGGADVCNDDVHGDIWTGTGGNGRVLRGSEPGVAWIRVHVTGGVTPVAVTISGQHPQ